MHEEILFGLISSRAYRGDLVLIIGPWAAAVTICHRGGNIPLGGA